MLQLILLIVACQTGAPEFLDHARLLVYRDSAGTERKVKTRRDWEKRRSLILQNMQAVMGPLPDSKRRVPLDIRIESVEETPTFTRKKITFAVEKDDRLPAYLLIPRGLEGKAPAVLCLHQTIQPGKEEPAGVSGNPDLHYAAHLADRGYVALAPDYAPFGEYRADPYALGYVSGTMKGIWNHMRAVDVLESLPEVDGNRIGCIGHSLGGHNTLFLGVFDQRIKAMVSNCGFTSFPKYYGGNLAGWTSDRYMPRIANVYGKDPKKVPFDFPEVVAAIAPRALLVIAPVGDDNFEVSGVRDCVDASRTVYNLLGASPKLAELYPECKHEFPASSREAAYSWLDRWLKAKN